jgi:hypothetical protein
MFTAHSAAQHEHEVHRAASGWAVSCLGRVVLGLGWAAHMAIYTETQPSILQIKNAYNKHRVPYLMMYLNKTKNFQLLGMPKNFIVHLEPGSNDETVACLGFQ